MGKLEGKKNHAIIIKNSNFQEMVIVDFESQLSAICGSLDAQQQQSQKNGNFFVKVSILLRLRENRINEVDFFQALPSLKNFKICLRLLFLLKKMNYGQGKNELIGCGLVPVIMRIWTDPASSANASKV